MSALHEFSLRALDAEKDGFAGLYPNYARAEVVDVFSRECHDATTAEALIALWQAPTLIERLASAHNLPTDVIVDTLAGGKNGIAPLALRYFDLPAPCRTLPPLPLPLPLISVRADGHGVVATAVPCLMPTAEERDQLAQFYGVREVSLVCVQPEEMRVHLTRLLKLGEISFDPLPPKEWQSDAARNGALAHVSLRGFRPPTSRGIDADGDESRANAFAKTVALWREIDARFATHYSAVPVYVSNRVVTLAVPDGTNTNQRGQISDEIGRQKTRRKARFVFAPAADLELLISAARIDLSSSVALAHAQRASAVLVQDTQQPVEEIHLDFLDHARADGSEKLLQVLLASAVQRGASDVILDRAEDLWVRYRVNGTWESAPHRYPVNAGAMALGRLKNLADLDSTDRKKPQDGSFSADLRDRRGTQKYLFRVTTVRTFRGEEATIRLQANDAIPNLDSLPGMPENVRRYLRRVIRRDNGLFIVSGPTGSGKTTTLHGLIGLVDRERRRVIALEAPVERVLPGVTQTEIVEGEGGSAKDSPMVITWPEGTRNALRRAPDIILIGEIRDGPTAAAVLEAATTGHFTLGSLHTQSSADVGQRLYSLGGDPNRFIDAFVGALAQRLVPKPCPHCAIIGRPTEEVCLDNGVDYALFRDIEQVVLRINSDGCSYCTKGKVGRQGIYELCAIDTEDERIGLARAAYEEASGKVLSVATYLRGLLRAKGQKTLSEAALELTLKGEIALAEYAKR